MGIRPDGVREGAVGKCRDQRGKQGPAHKTLRGLQGVSVLFWKTKGSSSLQDFKQEIDMVKLAV